MMGRTCAVSNPGYESIISMDILTHKNTLSSSETPPLAGSMRNRFDYVINFLECCCFEICRFTTPTSLL